MWTMYKVQLCSLYHFSSLIQSFCFLNTVAMIYQYISSFTGQQGAPLRAVVPWRLSHCCGVIGSSTWTVEVYSVEVGVGGCHRKWHDWHSSQTVRSIGSIEDLFLGIYIIYLYKYINQNYPKLIIYGVWLDRSRASYFADLLLNIHRKCWASPEMWIISTVSGTHQHHCYHLQIFSLS